MLHVFFLLVVSALFVGIGFELCNVCTYFNGGTLFQNVNCNKRCCHVTVTHNLGILRPLYTKKPYTRPAHFSNFSTFFCRNSNVSEDKHTETLLLNQSSKLFCNGSNSLKREMNRLIWSHLSNNSILWVSNSTSAPIYVSIGQRRTP